MNSIATIIPYCSLEKRFLPFVVHETRKFSAQVVIPVCTHLFDGKEENKKELEEMVSQVPGALFVLYPFEKEIEKLHLVKKMGAAHFWHSFSRWIACQYIKEQEWVLFLDADEVPEGDRMNQWLATKELDAYAAVTLANYWYFREPIYQATTWEASPVLIKKERMNKKIVLHKDERNGTFFHCLGEKKKDVVGADQKPMVHHYSWVRTKEEMLNKVRSWGHRLDRDWEKLVEEEFTHPFLGKDFVHGYRYKEVESFISENKKNSMRANSEPSQMIVLNRKDLLSLFSFWERLR